ncbi:MAG: M28 family peptidase [Ignavibacteriales bacterium]|nr:M28 family peptidase [Ignavibacteriales bacterium]
MKKIYLLLFIFSSLSFSQETKELLDPYVRDILNNTLSGEKAKIHVTQISNFHRVQASPGYDDAANYVLEKLREYGYTETDAYIESFQSDGKKEYQTWQSPSGWEISSAELSIVEPEQLKLVSYPDVAMSLMTYSNPGDLTAEVISVDAGTADSNYAGKNVKGKFVLATGSGEDVHRLAVIKYGAKAVISYLDDKRGRENTDMIRYTGIWPRTEELKKVTFGFNISNAQGEKIKSLIANGTKVVLHGKVVGKGLFPSSMKVVVAQINGKQPNATELVFISHLDHPKECANDNASGSAANLDIARTLKELIGQRKLPVPNKTIKFLWVPEWYGTMAYIDAHPEFASPALNGKTIAAINMDMVGENPELLHSKMYIIKTPRSVTSCINDVVENMAGMVDKMNIKIETGSKSQFNYRVVPYRGGSDHMMLLDRKIPTVMLSHSDYTHHTTYDTPENVDPTELQRAEMIAASSIWYLANLSDLESFDLYELVKSNSYRRFGEMARQVRSKIFSSKIKDLSLSWAESDNALQYQYLNETDAVRSLQFFNNNSELVKAFEQIDGHYGKRFEFLFGLTRSHAEENGYSSATPPSVNSERDERVPVRLTRGPLDLRLPWSKLPSKDAAWYETSDFILNETERFELVNLINGKWKVYEIRNFLTAEYRTIPDSVVVRFISDLIKIGLVKWSQETIK